MFRKALLCALTVISLSYFVKAESVAVIQKVTNEAIPLNNFAGYIVDSAETLTWNQLFETKLTFTPLIAYKLQNPQPVIWVKFFVCNQSDNNRLVLNLSDWKSGDSIDVYVFKQQTLVKSSRSGYFRKASELDYPFNNALSKVSLVVNKTDTVMVLARYKTGSGFGSIPDLSLEHEPLLLQNNRHEGLIHGVFQGLIWLIAIFSLSFFAFLHERIYLYYTFYIAIFSAYFLGQDGFLFELLLPNRPSLANLIYATSSILSPTFFLLFTRRLILQKEKLQFWVRGHLWLIAIYFTVGFMVLVSLLNNNIKAAFLLVNFTVLSSSFYIIPFLIRLIRVNDSDVRYVMLATLTVLVFSVWGVISLQFNIRFGNFSAYELMKVGVTLELTFFNVAIAHRIYKNEKDKFRTREALIEQLKINQSIKDKMNEELEALVKLRTHELENQKTEILAQRDDIFEKNRMLEDKNHEILAQKETIERSHKLLTDSLNYARIIQDAIIPSADEIGELFPNYFLISEPKDVVSGDFFWVKHRHGKTMIAVADCTGHGVPGAMLSVLGVTSLDKITRDTLLFEPSATLEMLRKDIIATLHQEREIVAKEGIDMAMCLVDKEKSQLIFSGAHQPGIIIRKGDLIKMEPNRQPIAKYIKEVPFENQTFDLLDGDMIYLYTDGYFDQLGGLLNKKLLSTTFKNKLLEIHEQPCQMQQQLLQDMFQAWKGSNEQTDDITILGIRFSKDNF